MEAIKVTVDGSDRLKMTFGAALIDFEHRSAEHSCCEGSEEVVLHFSNGDEVSIYFRQGEVVVEAD